jgi:hypothetical protein
MGRWLWQVMGFICGKRLKPALKEIRRQITTLQIKLRKLAAKENSRKRSQKQDNKDEKNQKIWNIFLVRQRISFRIDFYVRQ